MSDISGNLVPNNGEIEDRVMQFALKFRDAGIVDLSGARDTLPTWLDELEKHQLWLEADGAAHPGTETSTSVITPEEREALARLRVRFPSENDRIWQRQSSPI